MGEGNVTLSQESILSHCGYFEQILATTTAWMRKANMCVLYSALHIIVECGIRR